MTTAWPVGKGKSFLFTNEPELQKAIEVEVEPSAVYWKHGTAFGRQYLLSTGDANRFVNQAKLEKSGA